MPSHKDGRVYRIAGIPSAINGKAAVRGFLADFFDSDEARITIRSLGIHPQKPDFLVAIVGFSPTPTECSSGSFWRLEKTTHVGERSIIAHLEIDTEFLGFTPLNLPLDDDQCDKIDCIAVSGLSSHPFGSWKHRGGQFMWLVDDTDGFPLNVRVLLYGYDSTLFGSKSFQDIEHMGQRLATQIAGIRPLAGSSPSHVPRPLVFIAHSLGGLVVKEAVYQMANDDAADAQTIFGLVLFGVPHFGLLVEPWLDIIGGQPNRTLIEDLSSNSRVLRKLDSRFRSVFTFSDSKVVSLFETMTSGTVQQGPSGTISRTGARKVIVEPSSALGRWPDSVSHTQIPMNRSHEDLPKFSGQFDSDYLVLKPFLEEIWVKAVQVVQARLDAINSKPQEMATESVGLIQLWPYKEMGETVKTEIDIVAVHGLRGHPLESWMDADRLWLRDFLPSQFRYVRVFTFGYESDLAFAGDGSNIPDHATMLLEELSRIRRRDGAATQRRTIFICHSLGGILFKQAFNIAQGSLGRYSSVAKSIVGAIFLSTPHCGIDGPDSFWPGLLARLDSLSSIGGNDALPGDGGYEVQSARLKEICTQFGTLGIGLQIFSFFEMHELRGFKILDKSFAILRLPNETTMPLLAHHNDICKFLTNSSQNYFTVADRIEELIGSVLRSSEEPEPSSYDKANPLSDLGAIDMLGVLDLLPVPFENSARWLLDHPEFRSWTSVQGRQTLWLHGPPGIGKTVLMRSAVAYLKDQRGHVSGPLVRIPVYFFFDGKDATRTTSDTFARSVLFQILTDEQTGPLLQQFLDTKLPTGTVAEAELWQILSTIVSRSHGIVFQFVVDAVDEALRHTSGLVSVVDRLQQLLALDWSGRTKLLISSRVPMPLGFRDVVSIDMNNNWTKTSVKTFIYAKVEQAIQTSRLLPQAKMEVETRITNRSRGNFLLAKLTWEQFSKSLGQSMLSREQIRARLSELDTVSPEFVSVYCTLLRSIPRRHAARVRTALAILRLSRTKLTIKELAYFATLNHHEVDPENKSNLLQELKQESKGFERYLLETCGYMIKQDAKLRTVEFAHISARDLFSVESAQAASEDDRQTLSRFTISDSDAHAIFHMLCLRIFELEDRSTWKQDYKSVVDGIHVTNLTLLAAIASAGKTPCFVYALSYCFDHYAAASPGPDLDRRLLQFLPTKLAYWCHMFWFSLPLDALPQFLRQYSLPKYPEPPRLSREDALFRTLARVDCHRIVKGMLSEGINVNYVPTKDSGNGFTLLSWAIMCERPESFKVLLRDEGVAVNYSDPPSAMKPLHHAALRKGNTFYIQTLIERRPEVDINARYSNLNGSGTPLHVTIGQGNILGAEVLLSQPGIDIWALDENGISAYFGFFRRKIWGPILKSIIQAGQVSRESLGFAVSNASQLLVADIHQWTEFQEEILRLVPQTVLQVDKTHGMNALIYYAYFGRRERLLWTLERIPKHGFLIRQESSRYDLLHLCADQGWEDIVHLLQRRYGVPSLASDHRGRTLLHWAMEQSWDTSRIVWAGYSSLLDVQDDDGQTAMHLAVINRNGTAVELLAGSGANCFLKDKKGMTPVHLAAELGFRDALQYFLAMDQREYGRTRDGAGLLHLLAIWFDGSLVEKFVRSKKALLDIVDKKGRTPLHYAAMAGNSSSVRQLLKLKAQVNLRDQNGMTALHESIRGGAVNTAMLLLNNDADYKLADRFGQNCLHLCLRYGAEDLLAYFLDHGVDVNQLDSFGMRPLHRASGGENARINIKRLVRKGADWEEACIPKRRSPLISAVERGRPDAVAAVISSMRKSLLSSRKQMQVLNLALRVASELESTAIEQILLTAGASVDKSKIKTRRWYLPGAEPEYNRLPLVPYERRVRILVDDGPENDME